MRRPRMLLATLAATAAVLAACADGSGDSAAEEPDDNALREVAQITVGVVPTLEVAPVYAGDEQGFFADRGIELALVTDPTSADVLPQVVSGEYAFGYSDVTSLLVARAQGMPLTVVASGAATTGEVGADVGAVVVGESSDITDASGLAGATVAVDALGAVGGSTTRYLVDQAGVDPASVELVQMPFAEMPGAIEAGRVDAAWVVEPFLTAATQQGAQPVLWNYAATDPDLTAGVYVTSKDMIAEDPGLVERFTAAMEESLQEVQQHPELARQVVSQYTDADEATAQAMTVPRWPGEVDADSVRMLAELAVQQGLVEERPDVDALLP